MEMKLSVLQLNNYIKRIFDAEELLIGIGLYGEVSNFKISGGNAFFDLKEEGSSISCMMFGSDVVSLSNGMQVMLYGRLSYYVKTGRISFIARTAEEIGKGALYLQYLELKEKLEKQGVFDVSHKKPIPLFSKKIGVVTSETGAVIHDIITTARNKNPKTDFVLYPVKVQGDGAEQTIAEGINYFSLSDVDVVIVARGGGSFEDLHPFNTEIVARAIFECKVPVISAVGHETDVSISDFASDLRCATPTAASETAVFDYYKMMDSVLDYSERITKNLENQFESQRDVVLNIAISCDRCASRNLTLKREKLNSEVMSLDKIIKLGFSEKKNSYELVNLSIQKDNPLSLLGRGFVVATKGDKIVKSKSDAEVGDSLELNFVDGKIRTKVTNKE